MPQKPALSAYISFAGPRLVSVYMDPGPSYESSDPDTLLLQFFAKTMFNLGSSGLAPQLRDYMCWAAQAA